MRKTIIAITLILSLCLSVGLMSACGSSGNGTDTDQPTVNTTETYDVGDFTFGLPAGWKAFPQVDVFADKDADGNSPIDTSNIYISKEAEGEWDLFSKPYVNVKRYDLNTSIWSSMDWYEDVKELTGITVQGNECSEAFEGTSSDYHYQMLTFATSDAQYVVTMLTGVNNNKFDISYKTPEVKAIMESLTSNIKSDSQD